jgi:hypothetical protein
VVETEHEDVEFIYQGQVDVLLKSEVRFSGRVFFLNPLQPSYGHVFVAIRIHGVLVSITEVMRFRAGPRNADPA